MLDTMTINKVVAGFCGALLVFLLGGWFAEEIYHTGGGHGDGHGQAYVIDTGVDDSGDGGEEEAIDVGALVASADIAKGEKVFGKCKACHKLDDGANGTGPTLFQVVGRPVEAIDGFKYSGALAGATDAWSEQALFDFLEKPNKYAKGTSMGFAGLKKPADRANLIAWLKSLQ